MQIMLTFGILVCRFFQLVGLLIAIVGATWCKPLLEYVQHVNQKEQDISLGTLASKILPVTAPIFGGLIIIFLLQMAIRYWKDLAKRQAEFPEQPWMWRKDWADQHIKLSSRGAIIGLTIAWLFFLLIATPAAVWLAEQKNPKVVYIFLGVFALMLLGFTRMLWVGRRWHQSELKLAANPGVLGGPISGVILLKDVFDAGTVFRTKIKCEQTRQSSGKNDSTRTDVLWQDEKLLDRVLESEPGSSAIPFDFAIPFGCIPTSEKPIRRKRNLMSTQTIRVTNRWYVEVSIRDDLINSVRFEVPVFKTADSSPSYKADATLLEDYLHKPDAIKVLTKLRYRDQSDGHLHRYSFYLFRGDIFWTLVVMVLLIGVGLFFNFKYVSIPPAIYIAIIPVLIGLAMIYGMFQMLFWKSSVTIADDEVTIETGYAGFRRRGTFPRSIKPVLLVEQEHKTQNNAPPVFCIRVSREGGKPLDLVLHIDSRQDADAVRNWILTKWQTEKQQNDLNSNKQS
jgi:hypothetical protein